MTLVNTSARQTGLPAVMVERLDEVRRREKSLELAAGLMDSLTLFLTALCLALVADWIFTLFSTPVRVALSTLALIAGGVGLLLLAVLPRFKRRTLSELGAAVDQSVPALEERWETVTRLTASTDPETIAGSRALFDRVVRESVAQARHVNAEEIISSRRLRKHQWFLAAAAAANIALFVVDPAQAWVLLRRFCSPQAPIALTQVSTSGDLAVARGEPLRLEATLAGRRRDTADLYLRDAQGLSTLVSLGPSDAEGARYGHLIDAVDQPFSYRFQAGDGQSDWHDVAVYDRPRLLNVELRLVQPEYTHLPVITKSELPTSLHAVEGSRLELRFFVDQPLEHFDLQVGQFGADSKVRVPALAGDALCYAYAIKLDKTVRIAPNFMSRQGLSNLRPPSCQIIVSPDRPPEVSIASPEREISLRPNDKVTVEFAARDDFGVTRAELVVRVGDEPEAKGASERSVVLPIPLGDQAGKKTVRGKVTLDLAKFQLKQGEQLQYQVRVYDSRNARSPDAGQPGDASASGGQNVANQDARTEQNTRSSVAKNDSTSQKGAATTSQPGQLKGTPQRSESMTRRALDKTQSTSSSTKPAPDRRAGEARAATAKSAPSQPQSSSAGQNNSTNQKTAKAETPQGHMSGAARPPDSMTRRMLDVGQSASSSTMKIHIDKWAGSFAGQARRKLELQIDPVLKELDALFAKAIEELRPVGDELTEGKPAGDKITKPLRAADTQIAQAQALVAELVQKSEGTPYAFIGLQLVDITELHVSPARLELKAARTQASEQKQHVQQAIVHLLRAREMLSNLTRQYEAVKRDLQMADEMQRIKTMYQVFIEDAMAFLASNRPTLNLKNRKMAELELDEEFMKQYRQLAQEWEKTLAELAKALSKDPRLLARYMSLSRRQADSLRDQLTLLNQRQQELGGPLEQLAGENSASAGKSIRMSLSRDLDEIAAGTISLQEELATWMPQKMKDDPKSAALPKQTATLATLAASATRDFHQLNQKRQASAAGKVDRLTGQLKAFETELGKFASSDDAQMTLPVNRRLAQVRRLERQTATWSQKAGHFKAMRLSRALEVDQHRLSEDTLELTGKLETAGAQLAGLPDDVLALADEVKDILRFDVLVGQMSAELGLRNGDLPAAKTQQKKAIEGFARAEDRFNKLIDRVIQEENKVPPQVPDLDNMQLPTLEDLLARLENEQDLAELLGIPNRPTNLQELRGWLMQNSGSGSGSGNMSGAMATGRLLERARQDALRAARKNQEADRRARPLATASHWNTLGSRLEDIVRQGRGNTPPRQYRRAIERYFELISGANKATENGAPTDAAKDNARQNAPVSPDSPKNGH